ncbi:MAG TPA: thiamine pyrophosphate-dependent enzyme, partial [Candidatus Limnocylindria bacterium]|nr:thiamine pyrophosphate-dependent enzyme [Candidatus Limnocylindria bacterium]
MRKIRAFEERAATLFGENKIWGTIHSYAGEEAIATGVCAHLRDDDWITSTHRGHGHCIAKGADLTGMFAELLGKETGYCRGRGGSMHIADTSKGNLGAN